MSNETQEKCAVLAQIAIEDNLKMFRSPEYNYTFDMESGFFARWGKTQEDDPDWSPFGPEIADIEVTTSCSGVNGKLCPFCYKANTPNGKNMSFETFKTILDKMPPSLTQVAFGADSKAESNPDLWRMMEYCRELSIVPNITVADITDETADKLVKYCGAVAVSRYADKDPCYNSVKKLVDRGLNQVNIHCMISKETENLAMETISDARGYSNKTGDLSTCTHIDMRLSGLNAIVFLSLKQRGRGGNYTPLTQSEFNTIVERAMSSGVGFGFDSCSGPKFMEATKDHERAEEFKTMIEPCESSLFSVYVDVHGNFYPCSFAEGITSYGYPTDNNPVESWDKGIHIPSVNSFLDEVWNHPKTQSFRKHLIGTCSTNDYACRECPLFVV